MKTHWEAAKKAHSIIGDKVNTGNLLEALVDDAEKGAAEVLRAAVCEDVA